MKDAPASKRGKFSEGMATDMDHETELDENPL